MSEPEIKFVNWVCPTRHVSEVICPTVCSFDPVTREWSPTGVIDVEASAFCAKCGAKAEQIPLEGEQLHEARAHALAIDNGWLPSDEDTAIEFCDMDGLDYKNPIPDEVTT
jgi:hypothetical protein